MRIDDEDFAARLATFVSMFSITAAIVQLNHSCVRGLGGSFFGWSAFWSRRFNLSRYYLGGIFPGLLFGEEYLDRIGEHTDVF